MNDSNFHWRASGLSFHYIHQKSNKVTQERFRLHNHNGYEILIFLKGMGNFIVEGSVYTLHPMDIVITRYDEMHQAQIDLEHEYERIVINLDLPFFEKNDCSSCADIFLNRSSGEGNLIPRDAVKNSELFETLLRFEQYSKAKKKPDETLLRCVLIEFLYQLNELHSVGTNVVQNESVKNVIQYINAHLAETLTLDLLAERFYISKYHLCRCFRKYTGFTVNQYITYRRMIRVRDLHREGKNLSIASSEAGFSSYSNFYKAYVRETGYPPSEGLSGTMKG